MNLLSQGLMEAEGAKIITPKTAVKQRNVARAFRRISERYQ